MKFGVADYGMNVWDGALYDIELRLKELKSIGYDGTERLECLDAADAVYKAAIYRKLGMDFATCLAPNVSGSLRFTAALGKDYVWFDVGDCSRRIDMETYCRRCRKMTEAAAAAGVRAVLHNHLGSRIENQQELDEFMEKVPQAYLLLDIGHLHGAGGDVPGTIEKYYDRLESIHFKDYVLQDQSIGLDFWYKRLRFCELGGGNDGVPWREAAELLKRKGYDKWVLVEHDTHLQEPLADLKTSIDQLKKIFH